MNFVDQKGYNQKGTRLIKIRWFPVPGSTRKVKRQKGTGTARAGSIKSPLLRGGGRIFGPRPRDYGFKLNKKVKQLARFSALTYKAKNNAVHVIEDFNLEAPKTKEYKSLLDNLNLGDRKSLMVLNEPNKNIYLSSRNLQQIKVLTLSELNTYDIMNANNIVFVESSLNNLQKEE